MPRAMVGILLVLIVVVIVEGIAGLKLLTNVRDAARHNCEATKADRIDGARSATAQAVYLEKVLAATSVKGDVKLAATGAHALWSESANQLRRRLWNCEVLVEQGRHVIDRDALLEAQGKL